MDELRIALELATDEELEGLTQLLFRPRFNPLDYINRTDPIEVQSRRREDWISALETRFRFLAADGLTVLRGQSDRVSYRDVLIQICRYLRIPYNKDLSTTDIEAEIFLNLMGRTWKQLPASEQKALMVRVQKSLAKSELPEPLPVHIQSDPVGWLVKGGSALAVSSVLRPILLNQLARQFAIEFAKYQMAKEALRGTTVAASKFKSYVALQMARRGMASATARYTMTRTVFAFVGPALWAWFFADIGWRSISTNYARIIPTVFALAQIRLTRGEAWVMG
ncbi:YaaW family protein [Baaleninema sp.]|uniref:YaaW family protein n=1 Tax=Baaleninema sp. TaxID=3101197 RepID=UPI003D03BBA5